MVTILTGGGYGSRQVKKSTAPKTEPVAHKASPAGAAQQGLAVQFKKEPLQAGKGYEARAQGSTGIANASKGPAGAGPGGYGRTIYKSGSQSPTPQAREMGHGRDILSEYGPDVPGRGRR